MKYPKDETSQGALYARHQNFAVKQNRNAVGDAGKQIICVCLRERAESSNALDDIIPITHKVEQHQHSRKELRDRPGGTRHR